jgi:glycosyltransferase involved in cell wall biosynthesis
MTVSYAAARSRRLCHSAFEIVGFILLRNSRFWAARHTVVDNTLRSSTFPTKQNATQPQPVSPNTTSPGSVPLLIAIPTYNRAARLHDTLTALAQQLTPHISVLIIDNHSTDHTPTVCEEFRSRYPQHVKVSRNKINVGACPNIMKCFEAAEDGWLWVLPDDDKISPDALGLVQSTVRRQPAAAFINFSTSLLSTHGVNRSQEAVFSGQDDFLEKCDSFGNILFLTATIYNCAAVKDILRTAYLSLNTFAPQVAVQLATLAKCDATAVQSDVKIADWGARVEWSNQAVSDGVVGLLKLVPTMNGRRNLSRLIEKEFPFAARSRSRLSAAFNAAADGPATLSDRIAKCGVITAFTGKYRFHLVLLLTLQLLDCAHFGQSIRFVRSALDRLRKRNARSGNDGALAEFEKCTRL